MRQKVCLALCAMLILAPLCGAWAQEYTAPCFRIRLTDPQVTVLGTDEFIPLGLSLDVALGTLGPEGPLAYIVQAEGKEPIITLVASLDVPGGPLTIWMDGMSGAYQDYQTAMLSEGDWQYLMKSIKNLSSMERISPLLNQSYEALFDLCTSINQDPEGYRAADAALIKNMLDEGLLAPAGREEVEVLGERVTLNRYDYSRDARDMDRCSVLAAASDEKMSRYLELTTQIAALQEGVEASFDNHYLSKYADYPNYMRTGTQWTEPGGKYSLDVNVEDLGEGTTKTHNTFEQSIDGDGLTWRMQTIQDTENGRTLHRDTLFSLSGDSRLIREEIRGSAGAAAALQNADTSAVSTTNIKGEHADWQYEITIAWPDGLTYGIVANASGKIIQDGLSFDGRLHAQARIAGGGQPAQAEKLECDVFISLVDWPQELIDRYVSAPRLDMEQSLNAMGAEVQKVGIRAMGALMNAPGVAECITRSKAALENAQ